MRSSLPSFEPGASGPDVFFLAADVGGTHARVGLGRTVQAASGDSPVELLHGEVFACAQWPGLGELLADFVARLADTPWGAEVSIQACVLACAGYVQETRS